MDHTYHYSQIKLRQVIMPKMFSPNPTRPLQRPADLDRIWHSKPTGQHDPNHSTKLFVSDRLHDVPMTTCC